MGAKKRSIASHSWRAPIEVEGNGDGADLGDGEERFEVLGPAADRKADQIAFADTLIEQIIGQAIGALVQFAHR